MHSFVEKDRFRGMTGYRAPLFFAQKLLSQQLWLKRSLSSRLNCSGLPENLLTVSFERDFIRIQWSSRQSGGKYSIFKGTKQPSRLFLTGARASEIKGPRFDSDAGAPSAKP